jgi:hypothetical protein
MKDACIFCRRADCPTFNDGLNHLALRDCLAATAARPVTTTDDPAL